jgi:hypothetical protein
MSTISYLDRFLEPVTGAFTPQIASVIVGLRADPELQAEIDELRRKANEGQLTAAEDAAYEELNRLAQFWEE